MKIDIQLYHFTFSFLGTNNFRIMKKIFLMWIFFNGICINANSQLPSYMKEQLYQHHAGRIYIFG